MPATSKISLKPIGRIAKFILLLMNLLAILLLILSVMAWLIVPTRLTFVAYLGLGFPAILVLNILFLVIWAILWQWKYVFIQFVILLCCYSPILTYCPINMRTKEIPENTIKILTYNVRGFNWLTGDTARHNPMVKYIVDCDADIVCLQEFIVSGDNKNKRGLLTEKEFNKLMDNYPYHSIIRLGEKKSQNLYGLALYSKYPIKKQAEIPINSPYNGSAIYELEIGKKVITLVNNHLESNRITAEDKILYNEFIKADAKSKMINEVTQNIQERLGTAYRVREEQANIISGYIQKHDSISDGIIVCGDFNDVPNSFTYHKIKGDLIDAYATTGLGPGITFHENMFLFRIDFIFHSLAFNAYNCTVGKVKYSDHYPVWTYLEMK